MNGLYIPLSIINGNIDYWQMNNTMVREIHGAKINPKPSFKN